jgi:hypothetical protein
VTAQRRRHYAPRMAPPGLPDVRDGLTRTERVVLWKLDELQKEYPNRGVPTAALYGRVVEHVSLSEPEFLRVLQRLIGPKR